MTRKVYYLNEEMVYKPKKIILNNATVYSPSDRQLELAGYVIKEEAYSEPSQEELEQQAKLQRIEELKYLLQASDYKAIKFAEGEMSAEEYESSRLERRAWRDEINVLEVQIVNETQSDE